MRLPVRGITQVRAEVDLHAEQVVAVARRPGRRYGVPSLFEVVAGRVRFSWRY